MLSFLPRCLLVFLDGAANFLPGGFSCWEALVCWELKGVGATCQRCRDFQGEVRGAGSVRLACSLAETSASLFPASQSEIFWDSVKNAHIPGGLCLVSDWEKAENMVFSYKTGYTCFAPVLPRAGSVLVAARAAARLFFWSKLNTAKTGRGLTSHPCISLLRSSRGSETGHTGQAEVGMPDGEFRLSSQPLLSPPPPQVLLASHDG